jgi:chemotaxis protein MotB
MALGGNRQDTYVVGNKFVFPAEALFSEDSADLTDAAKKALEPVLASLCQIATEIPDEVDWVVRIEGHTDARPPDSSRFSSNMELSIARAKAVFDYAIERSVPHSRFAVSGFGEYQPVDRGTTEEAHRRNRRIEFILSAP